MCWKSSNHAFFTSYVLMIAADELHNPISWFGLTRVRLLCKKFVAASSPNEPDWLNFPHWCWKICINVACITQSNKLVSANYAVALLLCVCVLFVCVWHASWNTNYAMWTFVFFNVGPTCCGCLLCFLLYCQELL